MARCEVPEVVASRLLARYGEDGATGVKRPLPYLKNATVPKGLTSVVQLVAEGDTPQHAVDLLNDAFVYVRESHELIYSHANRWRGCLCWIRSELFWWGKSVNEIPGRATQAEESGTGFPGSDRGRASRNHGNGAGCRAACHCSAAHGATDTGHGTTG